MAIGGAVAAGASPAARIGAEVIARGGNAVDAAVATVLAMGVADPANASVAGRCHVLVVHPDNQAASLDGRSALPAKFADAPPDTATDGAAIVSVPGNPVTLHESVRRWGRLSWAEISAPAARLAAEGVFVPPCLGAAWANAAPGLRGDPAARALFLTPDGAAPPVGTRFVQPRLARTLEDLSAEGPSAVMAGPRASRVLAALRARGSLLTQEDFSQYQALEGEIVRCPYRGWQVVTIGRQGYGHTLAEVLGILARFDLANMAEDERWLHLSIAQRLGRQDRPPGEADEAAHLIAPDFLDRRAEDVRALLRDGPEALLARFGPPPEPPAIRRGDTTHISAVDADGRACAITTSIGPHFGALVAAAEDGFLLPHSYRMAERDHTARRDRTEMLPTILLGPHGERVALGAAGSSRIPGAVLRAIVAIVDLGQTPAQALSAPPTVWHDGRLRTHPGIGADVIARLEAAGLPVDRILPPPGQHFGLVHVARRRSDGLFDAAADPWWDGAAFTVSEHGIAALPAASASA